MTAVQVTNNITDIMKLPCVSECRKYKDEDGKTVFAFYLLNGLEANEGDWIIEADSEFFAWVASQGVYQLLKDKGEV